jgi:hypothetical protein
MNEEEATKTAQKLTREWLALHARRPPVLYHYTNAAGLVGMLQSQRLWATNSRFMNDPTEVEYAANMIREALKAEKSHREPGLFRKVRSDIYECLRVYENENENYLTCFCKNGDLLSQWRGYGAVGGGYAIGFDARCLGPIIFPPDRPQPVLRRVLYDQKQQRRLIRKWLTIAFDWEDVRRTAARRVTGRFQGDDVKWKYLIWFVSESLRCFKDPAYEEEQEWRSVQYMGTVDDEMPAPRGFRTSGDRIVQFIELDFTKSRGKYHGKLPIKSIRYGSTLDQKVTERLLRLLCRDTGYAEDLISIGRSGIPLSR